MKQKKKNQAEKLFRILANDTPLWRGYLGSWGNYILPNKTGFTIAGDFQR